jgi:NAD(P)-dependent dehydrogenase (short-subunit alcohol dehydrogenase family)
MNQLLGKCALITGAASGIGQAMALLFAREGASVAVADLDLDRGAGVARRIADEGGRAIFVRCDVTVAKDCEEAVRRTVDELGRLDILVNNVGIIRRASVTESSEEEWDRVLAVNLKSVFLLSRAAIPVMARGGGGAIVNTSSGWGLVGGARAASYCASKGAVVVLSKAMAIDHAPQNIRVNCLCPGDTDTPMLRDEASQLGRPLRTFLEEAARRPMCRIGTPEEIAGAALFLASESASFITGATLVVDGGGLAG